MTTKFSCPQKVVTTQSAFPYLTPSLLVKRLLIASLGNCWCCGHRWPPMCQGQHTYMHVPFILSGLGLLKVIFSVPSLTYAHSCNEALFLSQIKIIYTSQGVNDDFQVTTLYLNFNFLSEDFLFVLPQTLWYSQTVATRCFSQSPFKHYIYKRPSLATVFKAAPHSTPTRFLLF